LLDRVGDGGLKLSPADYAPPVFVTEAMQVLGDRVDWIGKHNREDLTYPAWEFRLSAFDLGLARKLKGRMILTPAGRATRGDAQELWLHLASRLPLGRKPVEQQAGVWLLLALAAGRPLDSGLAPLIADALTATGWTAQNRPIDPGEAWDLARSTYQILEFLGATAQAGDGALHPRDRRKTSRAHILFANHALRISRAPSPRP
jgi:hypothetical protein